MSQAKQLVVLKDYNSNFQQGDIVTSKFADDDPTIKMIHVHKGSLTGFVPRKYLKRIKQSSGGGGVAKPAPDEEKGSIEHPCKHSSNDNEFECKDNECNCNNDLLKFTTNLDGYSCSLCNNTFNKDTTMYGCRDCNVDLCQNCYQKVIT